jgi:biotin carboxylase
LANGQISGSITLHRDDPLRSRLVALAEAAVRALGASGRFVAHVEFLSAEGALYVGEVACRAPGGEIPWQCMQNCGVDLERLNLELQMGRATISMTRPVAASWIWIPGAVPVPDNQAGGQFVDRFLGSGWLSTDLDHQALAQRTAAAQHLLSEGCAGARSQ